MRGLKPEAKLYKVTEVATGLVVKVSPAGNRVFIYPYRRPNGNGYGTLTIGHYPAVSLAEAHEAVTEAKKKIKLGVDPYAEAKTERRSRIEVKLVSELADSFMRDGEVINHIDGVTIKNYEDCIRLYILPSWGKRAIEDIRRQDMKDLLAKLTEAGITRRANMTRSLICRMWKFAINEEIIENFPFTGIRNPARVTLGKRYLAEDEIALFWFGVDKIMSIRTRAILRLILILCRRPTEVIGAQWKEFNLERKEWFIPAERNINGKIVSSGLKIHRMNRGVVDGLMVPLPQLAVDVLTEWKKRSGEMWDHVFPAEQNRVIPHDHTAVAHTLNRSMERMGFAEDPFTPHDLRRSGRTSLARLLIPDQISDRITGHSISNAIHKTYNRYDALKEKREALDLWAADIERLLNAYREKHPEKKRVRKSRAKSKNNV